MTPLRVQPPTDPRTTGTVQSEAGGSLTAPCHRAGAEGAKSHPLGPAPPTSPEPAPGRNLCAGRRAAGSGRRVRSPGGHGAGRAPLPLSPRETGRSPGTAASDGRAGAGPRLRGRRRPAAGPRSASPLSARVPVAAAARFPRLRLRTVRAGVGVAGSGVSRGISGGGLGAGQPR